MWDRQLSVFFVDVLFVLWHHSVLFRKGSFCTLVICENIFRLSSCVDVEVESSVHTKVVARINLAAKNECSYKS